MTLLFELNILILIEQEDMLIAGSLEIVSFIIKLWVCSLLHSTLIINIFYIYKLMENMR